LKVGKTAEDNDALSCSTEHRDSADWWMHASGCPGSHVVIRCHDEKLNDNVIQDAAALAARHSKCSGAVVSVSLTRCRDVKKPSGAKAGLVHLTKISRTVKVRMSEATVRLARLDETCQIN
jgi:predicted ribosome quality control (RQC) complex YloA/Tae2 family protein